MKNKNQSKKKNGKYGKNTIGKGGCGCGNQNGGRCASCSMKMNGGGFNITPTTYFPSTHETYYPLNNYNNDPTMLASSSRMQGIPVSSGGRKRKYKKTKRTRRYKNKTKKQRGGINLGYIAQNSLLGHGQYGTWFGAPTQDPPEWNSSLFSKPLSTNTYGFTENNPYLV